MEIDLVQNKTKKGGDYVGNISLTFDNPVTEGNLLVAFISADEDKTISVSDDNENDWQRVASIQEDFEVVAEVWYAKNAKAGATTIEGVFSDWSETTLEIREYSGVDQENPLDVFAVANSKENYEQSFTIGPTAEIAQTNSLVVAMWSINKTEGDYSVDAPFENVSVQYGDFYRTTVIADYVTEEKEPQEVTFRVSDEWVIGAGIIAVFRQAPIPWPFKIAENAEGAGDNPDDRTTLYAEDWNALTDMVVNSLGVCLHLGNEEKERPKHFKSVLWIGKEEPTNAIENDMLLSLDNEAQLLLKYYNGSTWLKI